MTITRNEPPIVVSDRSISGMVLLVGAPLLMVIARLLLVPIDTEDWDATLDALAGAPARSDLGFVLVILASGGLTVSVVMLARRLVDAGRSRLATWGGLAAVAGWVGCAAIAGAGVLLSNLASAADRPAQLAALDPALDTGWEAVAFFGLTVLGALGYLAIAIGLARARVVSVGAAVLVGLGGATTQVTMSGPVRPVLVLAALLLLAGHALVATGGAS